MGLVEGGQIIVTGGELDLSCATIGGPLEITTGDGPESAQVPKLVSVERMDLSAPVTVAPGIDVSDCRFGRTPNLDQLRFVGTDQFDTHWRRQVIRAERDFRGHDPPETDRVDDPDSAPIKDRDSAFDGGDGGTNAGGVAGEARDIAGVYRQLRTSMEATKDYPGASDFYYGEMEMR
ncbi:MAG: hypothetical protein GY798_24130, partial [Hyphomicrobiales bacterium]|nr:hypothetical protein [Hyphomicrobiales bacterium]